uniref:Uncharacterized protein n=1 Tax=Monodelphis domestica TaxID=13616 RepID=A0A5F8H6W0_MONDO
MLENMGPRNNGPTGGSGNGGRGAYQDRDKPAQIRFSNISAAHGKGRGPARLLIPLTF